jgi:hypothetical protein
VKPDGDCDDGQRIEMYAQLTSGACQALANWWADHPEVPREALVDRAVAFCWTGLEHLPDGAG